MAYHYYCNQKAAWAIWVLAVCIGVTLWIQRRSLTTFQQTIIHKPSLSPSPSPSESSNNNNAVIDTTVIPSITNSLWIPVTDEELQPYLPCRHAYQHCCIGQSRRIADQKQNITSLLVKWNQPLSNLTHVLQALSLVQQQRRSSVPSSTLTNTHNDFCNLWFVGDSTTSDYAIGAMCELTRMQHYEIVDCLSAFDIESAVCERFANASIRLYNFSHMWLRHPDPSAVCPNVIVRNTIPVQHTFLNRSDNTAATTTLSHNISSELSFLRQGGLALWSWGAHCHVPGCMTQVMRSTLLPFVQQWHAEWIVQWREMEPSHWSSLGGVYETLSNKTQVICAPFNQSVEVTHRGIDNTTNTTTILNLYNNFRNKEGAKVLAKHHKHLLGNNSLNASTRSDAVSINQQRIPIIPVMHAMASQYTWHVGEMGDCTHYVYTPWRFHIVWDGIVKALLDANNTAV
jgi:hypothetical protein